MIDTVRFFDPGTDEWGYQVECLNADHHRPCPAEHELFRYPRGIPRAQVH